LADPLEQAKRKLDDVVGRQFDPLDAKGAVRKRLLKWIAGALCAVATVSLIVFIIESHRLPPKVPPRAAKPVVIQIVPETK
jgi:hypothetical protein